MRRAHAALALLAPIGASCSVLYDPGQYRGADASRGPDAADASQLDAPLLDAPVLEPDARPFDARAFDASELDAPELADAHVPADGFVSVDANAPDAWLDCTSPRSLALPSCVAPSGLVYCGPDGVPASFPRAMAEQALPGVAGYRVGLLGNAVDVVRRPAGTLTDVELVRGASMPGLLDVLVVGATETDLVGRRRYSVAADGLSEAALEVFEVGALTEADVSVAVGNPSDVAIAGRAGASPWSVWSCSDLTTCVTSTLMREPTAMAPLRVAHAGAAVAAAFEVGMVSVERVQPTSAVLPPDVGDLDVLRGTAGRFVYPSLATSTAVQAMYDLTATTAPFSIGIGTGRPRLTRIAGGSERYALARLDRVGGNLVVSRHQLECTAVDCGCVGARCDEAAATEATLILAGVPLVDWDYHELEGLRVVVLLVGDSSGTEVQVAFWGAGTSPTITPITVASGRDIAPPGVGIDVRSVARLTPSRLEIFVAARVQIGSEDVVYLSGLRLEGCGS